MEEKITFMKKGTTNKVSWFLLVFGESFVKTKNHIDIVEGDSVLVSEACYNACKVGMTITVKKRAK